MGGVAARGIHGPERDVGGGGVRLMAVAVTRHTDVKAMDGERQQGSSKPSQEDERFLMWQKWGMPVGFAVGLAYGAFGSFLFGWLPDPYGFVVSVGAVDWSQASGDHWWVGVLVFSGAFGALLAAFLLQMQRDMRHNQLMDALIARYEQER